MPRVYGHGFWAQDVGVGFGEGITNWTLDVPDFVDPKP